MARARTIQDRQQTDVVSTMRDMKAAYRMAEPSRFHSVNIGGASVGVGADWHLSERDYFQMMEMARWFEINDRLVPVAVRRCVVSVLGNGLTLAPNTGDKGLDTLLKSEVWDPWAENPEACDYAGQLDFNQMAEETLRRIIVDGDYLVNPVADADSLERLEGHRCRTPSNTTKPVRLGVLRDQQSAKPQEYWITKSDVGVRAAIARVSDVVPLKAYNPDGTRAVFHCRMPGRVSHSRGVTWLHPVGHDIGQTDDLFFAKLVQQQVQTCVGMVEEDILGGLNPVATQGNDSFGNQTNQTLADGRQVTSIKLEPGMIHRPAPGKKLVPFSPAINASDFNELAMMLIRILGLAFDIPLHVLILNASESNWSAWRGVTGEARKTHLQWASNLAKCLHRPVYQWRLRVAIARNPELRRWSEKLGARFFKHAWHPPQVDSVQPVDDANAGEINLGTGQISPSEFHARRGRDWDDHYEQTIGDYSAAIKAAIEAAKELNKLQADDPQADRVSWRDVLPLAQSVNRKLAPTNATAQQPQPAKPAGGAA